VLRSIHYDEAKQAYNRLFVRLLQNGFFHADPHAGNLLCTPEGKLCYLDFGMMSYVEANQRYGIIEAVIHLVSPRQSVSPQGSPDIMCCCSSYHIIMIPSDNGHLVGEDRLPARGPGQLTALVLVRWGPACRHSGEPRLQVAGHAVPAHGLHPEQDRHQAHHRRPRGRTTRGPQRQVGGDALDDIATMQ
jgi:hypothetical protein